MRLKNNQLGELLDRVYSIEGLLHLALSRPNFDEKIQRLITSDIFELADKIAEWDTDSLLAHREALADARAVTDENSSYTLDDEDIDDEIENTENVSNIIDENITEESIEAETAKAGLAADTTEMEIDEPMPLMATINDPIAPAVSPTQETSPLMATVDPPAAIVDSTHLEAQTEIPAAELPKTPRPRPVFSINDRYFFTRALFHQSHNEFESCIQAISLMDSYDEAEDYLVSEYDWDLEDSNVSMFLDIIHRYFDALQK